MELYGLGQAVEDAGKTFVRCTILFQGAGRCGR